MTDYGASAHSFKWLLEKAGVRYRNQYQTRHTFASQLLSGGENPYRAADQLGHKNVVMVMRVYGKWIEQGEKELRTKFVSEFANLNTTQG